MAGNRPQCSLTPLGSLWLPAQTTHLRPQDRVLAALKAEKPAHEKKIAFCKVDWDLYAKDALAHDMRIPRRSIFVLFMGRKEVGRIVTGAVRTDIEAFLEAILAAG